MVGNLLCHHHIITQSVSWCAEMMSRGVMEDAAGDGQNSWMLGLGSRRCVMRGDSGELGRENA